MATVLGIVMSVGWTGCGDAGTADVCASGGILNDCDDAAQTVEAACDRLVACGATALDDPDGNRDWAGCVDYLGRRVSEAERRYVVACIAASPCDELRSRSCLDFGEGQ